VSAAPPQAQDLRVQALAAVQRAQDLHDRGQASAAQAVAQSAVTLARECNDIAALGWGLMVLSRTHGAQGQLAQAHVVATEAYPLLGACGDLRRQLWALNTCANVEKESGNIARAIDLWRQGLAAAQGLDAPAQVALTPLVGLANCMFETDEYPQAIEYLRQALALALRLPQEREWQLNLATRLAAMHVLYARFLGKQGRTTEAAAQRQTAAAALPALGPADWNLSSAMGLASLCSQIPVLAFLGQTASARQASAAVLRAVRVSEVGLMARGFALAVVAELHRENGRLHLATAHLRRSFATHKTGGATQTALGNLKNLIDAWASSGAYRQALVYQKELRTLRAGMRLQASALRSRLDAIERHNERLRGEADKALAHSRRLVVIGRLIAQTHHALDTPVERARALTTSAQECRNCAELAPVIEALVQSIDSAAAVVSQLKLFTYRSAPEPAAVLLREALRQAWQDLAPHARTGGVMIQISDDPPLHAWADAQGLGILLRVLLIEITLLPGLTALDARIQVMAADKVLLEVLATGTAAAHHSANTLGLTLCQEIALEMGGDLQVDQQASRLHCRLQLPAARTHARPLPSALGSQ
jgi:signal transduction histidine kinase